MKSKYNVAVKMLCKMRGYKSHMSISDVNYILRRQDTSLFGDSLKLEGNSFHFRAALFFYGCGSDGCRSEESRLSVVNANVGVWPWVSEGKASHLSHPPLWISEL